jgi:hypothetical protein
MSLKRSIVVAVAFALTGIVSSYQTPDVKAAGASKLRITRRGFAGPFVAGASLAWSEAARSAVPTYDDYIGQPGTVNRSGPAPKATAKSNSAAPKAAPTPAATNRLSSLSAGKLPPLASLSELRDALVAADDALVALEPVVAKQVFLTPRNAIKLLASVMSTKKSSLLARQSASDFYYCTTSKLRVTGLGRGVGRS